MGAPSGSKKDVGFAAVTVEVKPQNYDGLNIIYILRGSKNMSLSTAKMLSGSNTFIGIVNVFWYVPAKTTTWFVLSY